jgi:hypothetical protein
MNIAAELVLIYIVKWSDRYIENIVLAGLKELLKRGRSDVVHDICYDHRQQDNGIRICPSLDCDEDDCPHYVPHYKLQSCCESTEHPIPDDICPECIPSEDFILKSKGLI